jgi:hypothetical protein
MAILKLVARHLMAGWCSSEKTSPVQYAAVVDAAVDGLWPKCVYDARLIDCLHFILPLTYNLWLMGFQSFPLP